MCVCCVCVEMSLSRNSNDQHVTVDVQCVYVVCVLRCHYPGTLTTNTSLWMCSVCTLCVCVEMSLSRNSNNQHVTVDVQCVYVVCVSRCHYPGTLTTNTSLWMCSVCMLCVCVEMSLSRNSNDQHVTGNQETVVVI